MQSSFDRDPDVGSVVAANNAYYEALSSRDLLAMERIWACAADDVNIAPPVRPSAHVGWAMIKQNYEQFWGTLDLLSVSMEEPRIRLSGNVAWVYGVEKVHRVTKEKNSFHGTNYGMSIFNKRDERWLLVFHQASPFVPR